MDEIRDIRDKSTYAPSLAKHKVYIIDEVHMLSTGAFNALLKTLEEPTENVVFILATTELHKIPATILSRVQRFEFKSIKSKDIVAHIEWILQQENIGFENDAVQIIARRAEGGMRDALSILDQALSLTQDNQLTTAISEEITGSISLGALDAYVTAVLTHDTSAALENLDVIFDSGKNMARFVTDLLQYLRDLLIVKTGGENTHISEIFLANLNTPQERLFELIEIATRSLAEIKNSLQPKIYTEMMTIRLAEGQEKAELPSNLVSEIETLKDEISQLKGQLASLQSSSAPSNPVQGTQSAKTSKGYRVDRHKVNAILQEAVENPSLARSNLTKLQNAWGEIIESLAGADKALLVGSQPVAANENHAILAFESSFNAEQTMKRENLNTMFGNLLSNVAGFSPDILAISMTDWTEIRAEFSAKARGENVNPTEETKEIIIPEGFAFLAEKISIQED